MRGMTTLTQLKKKVRSRLCGSLQESEGATFPESVALIERLRFGSLDDWITGPQMGTLDHWVAGRFGSQKPTRVLQKEVIPRTFRRQGAIWIFLLIILGKLVVRIAGLSRENLGSKLGQLSAENRIISWSVTQNQAKRINEIAFLLSFRDHSGALRLLD
jgi:hypothetical protein